MADFVTIPEIYIKEEPLESDGEKETTEELEDPFHSENEFELQDELIERKDEELTALLNIKNETALEVDDLPNSDPQEDEGASSSANIFEPEVNIESEEEDIKCAIDDLVSEFNSDDNDAEEFKEKSPLGQESPDYDNFDDQDYEPSDEEYEIRKAPKNDDRERKYQCPICGKFFLTSSAMNGHVAKGHGTTLGLKFTCHVCGAAGSSRASLKRHLIRTHKIKNVDHPELLTKKCTHCGIGFSSHLLLYEHIRADHSENLREYHNCSWCPALMRAKASLLRHIRRTHPGKEEPFITSEKCSLCVETFPTRLLLQRHMKSSHPNTPRHVCSVCNAGFKFPYMLSRHKISHEDPKKYEETRRKKKYSVVCEFCGRKFGSKPRLEYHIQVVHTNPPIKIYTCRLCGLTFPTAKQNNRHYRKVHRPERQKIHCGKCNITFNTQEECSQHRALHPNTCHVCQKQFLRRDSLREHLLIHSAPRHQCPHCTKKFTQRSNLKRHIRVHTGEKPYKCTFCSRCFSDKSACNSHIRVHTGYERSVCTVCGASFSKKQRLNYHMRIHTGEGLLYCPLCMRPSTNSYSLRKHIESHQQPLTKALTSLGFKPLLASDPNFVIRALQALTQATLRSMSRHENIPNSVIDNAEPVSNGGSILNTAPVMEENNIDECTKSLTNIARIEGELTGDEMSAEPSSTVDSPLVNEGDDEAPFNLTKFLQGLLERESQKVRTDRRDRRDRRLRSTNSLRNSNEGSNAFTADEERESEEEEELPTTIGDELVKQCLEIIMKDEPQSDCDEYDDNGAYSDQGMPIETECDQIADEFVIKTEADEFDFESEEQQQQQLRDEDETSKPLKGIPKIKISRIARTDTDSKEDLFVAEIIKKN